VRPPAVCQIGHSGCRFGALGTVTEANQGLAASHSHLVQRSGTFMLVLSRPSLARRRQLGDGVLPANLVGIELDLVAHLEGVEHGGVLYAVAHGHGWHVEALDLAVLEGDLLLRLVDLHDLAIAALGLGGQGGDGQ
jgi:hypothetical protein